MTKILFVDDEKNLVQSLRRLFYKSKDIWDVHYATNGAEAIKILDDNQIDIIITDFKMPEMSGMELLSYVKNRYPSIIRILLSGYSDDEETVESTSLAHQFFRKPINPDILENKIKHLIEINKYVSNPNIKNIVNEITALPSLPDVFIEIDKALKTDDVNLNYINNIIVTDVGISTKILQVVNSAFFGIPQRVYNTLEAINLLGIKTIQSVIANIFLFNTFPEKLSNRKRFSVLGSHSLVCGDYAKKFARSMNTGKELDAYMAGILHDAGKLVVFQLPDYDEVEQMMIERNLKLFEAEFEKYNTTHAEIGAYLLALWGLPEDIIDATAYHHTPSQTEVKKISLLTAVHVADSLTNKSPENIDWKYIISINAESGTKEFVHKIGNE